ncbi:hypothetical protein J7E96_32520 [Streptomyces sp. ISL-96]|uniref:hypothetical protein n=1 Tax=Streptomyces sp. ISL-96 TaxID=2819191 RepID=UPI001BEA0A4A|nr:hypothetical protein [Streptomyces sp. ISL-96]MBT2493148.1 hypothetical protein [Streptomyces sp. ISL-96]
MESKEGSRMEGTGGSSPSARFTAVGQRNWKEGDISDLVSSLESGELAGVSSVWIPCDPAREEAAWSSLLGCFKAQRFYAWMAKVSGGMEDAEPARESTLIAHRTGDRVSLKKFAMLSFRESEYRAFDSSDGCIPEFVKPLLHRTSGFAFALGEEGFSDEAWMGAVQPLESHFALAFDFENSPLLERGRRRLVGVYLRLAVEMGMLPVIPLDRHPDAGMVLFCAQDCYDDITGKLATHFDLLHGDAGSERIIRLLNQGGGLAYL